MKELTAVLVAVALATGLVWGAMLTVRELTSMPTEYRSWTTQQCERAEHSNGSPMSCSELPLRRHIIWVE